MKAQAATPDVNKGGRKRALAPTTAIMEPCPDNLWGEMNEDALTFVEKFNIAAILGGMECRRTVNGVFP